MREISGIRNDIPPGTREVIRKAIMEFRFSMYGGFDEIENSKEDPDTCEWADHLAALIDQRLDPMKILIRIERAEK